MRTSVERAERLNLLLMQIMRSVRKRRIFEQLQEVGFNQHLVLNYLYYAGPSSVGTLRRELSCATSTASELIERLVRQGLLQKARDPEDGRVVLIDLTEAGHELLRELRQRLFEANKAFLEELAEDEQRMFLRALGDIAELMCRSGHEK